MQAADHNEFLALQRNWTTGISGVSVTPGTINAMGSWFDLMGGLVAQDTYGLWLYFYQGATAGQSNATLADVGMDAAGGTSYRVLAPKLQACSTQLFGGPKNAGYYYYFPIFIPAGARLGIRAQQSLGVAVAFTARAMLMQKPRAAELVKVGTFIDAYGVDAVNSRGTNLTFSADPTTEGPWNSLGSVTRAGWYVQTAAGIDDSAMANTLYLLDFAVGDASNKRVFSENQWMGGDSAEQVGHQQWPYQMCFCTVPQGANLYARAMSKNNPTDSNVNAMVYVVGG